MRSSRRSSRAGSYSPSKIMDYDSKVWDKLDIHSRTEMDQKGLYPRYRALMKKKFPKPMSRKTMLALENENFHSAYEAIGYK